MNAKLAKEERRNLRKAMGETATDALERARSEVLQLRMEHAAIAKELADCKVQAEAFATLMRSENLSLNGRIDGTAAWCQQNEEVVKHLEGLHTHHCRVEFESLRRWRVCLEGTSVWHRLLWVLRGYVYGYDDLCCEMCGGRQFNGRQCVACVASGRVRPPSPYGAEVAPSQVVIE